MSNAEEKLRKVLNCVIQEKFRDVSNVKIKPITSGGSNCTSQLLEAKIITSEDTLELFAKVSSMAGIFDEAGTHLFNTEEFMLTTISSAFEKLQDKYGMLEKFTFPKFYTSADGIIVMENLASKGYACYDRLKSIDWEYASKSVEVLAKFHALSLAFNNEYPEEYKKLWDVLILPRKFVIGSHWQGITDGAYAAVDKEDREILSRLLEDCDGMSKMLDIYEPRKTSVIVHGDFRACNLMHTRVNGEYHIIPVDYQIAQMGCPVGDLLYFIVLGSDQQFRKKHFHQLVNHYYEHLALMMTKFGLKPEEVYGKEEFESDMKAKLPISLGMAATSLPFVTVDAGSGTDFETGRYVPRANELFAERFRGLLQDYKLWGVI